jgi:transposase-like protein
MRKHRSYPVEFKRQVAQEYLAGETLHGLAKRHEINRNLVRIWVAKRPARSTTTSLPPSRRPVGSLVGQDHRQSRFRQECLKERWVPEDPRTGPVYFAPIGLPNSSACQSPASPGTLYRIRAGLPAASKTGPR